MSSMDHVGLGNLFQKKEFTIDGKKRIFYQNIDVIFCCKYNFNNIGKEFIILSGKFRGGTISNNSSSNSNYKIAGFMTLKELCQKNNQNYDYGYFIEEYEEGIGDYFSYDPDKRLFSRISDSELIKQIKGFSKDYDDSILNTDTDISQMYSIIKKTIISQDEQIMQILTSLFKNQKVINSSFGIDMISKLKENIIVYGSTGTGKTEILKRIASIFNIPIVIEDATSLSEIGYVGRNITDMLENLYLEAGKDIEKAQTGILVIDEFDKLAENNNSKDHVSRIGVQRSLLKLLDGSTFYFGNQKFNTSKLSVVVLGAFTGIVDDDDYSKISSIDFVKYGIMRELMGRFSKLIAMNPLSKEDIKKILIESNFSPLNTYRLLFESMGIEFSYDEDFVDYVAEKAVVLKTGARSLKQIVDEEISSAMFRIFAGDYSAIRLVNPDHEEKSYVLTRKLN